MTIREFWERTHPLPRMALACAGVALAINLATYAGLAARGWLSILLAPHLAVMALGFAFFARIARHHRLAWRSGPPTLDRAPVPRALVWGIALSLVYLLCWTAVVAAQGEGSPEVRGGQEVWVDGGVVVRTLAPGARATFEAQMLRVFSAAWLFFALAIAVGSHIVERRIRAYETPDRAMAADD